MNKTNLPPHHCAQALLEILGPTPGFCLYPQDLTSESKVPESKLWAGTKLLQLKATQKIHIENRSSLKVNSGL